MFAFLLAEPGQAVLPGYGLLNLKAATSSYKPSWFHCFSGLPVSRMLHAAQLGARPHFQPKQQHNTVQFPQTTATTEFDTSYRTRVCVAVPV